MKKARKNPDGYEDGAPRSLFNGRVVFDFLPSPEELIKEEETVKVTLLLTKRSVAKIKKLAKSQGTKYQRVIRNLVDDFASR